MKKIHLFGLLIIAAAVTIILSTAGDASTYVDFGTAEEMARSGDNGKVHVIGSLKKDAAGRVEGLVYDPAIDANHLEFTLADTLGQARKVIYNNPKPADMDKSEKIVIIGQMQGEVFKCDKILLKCPSKYEAEAPEVASNQAKKE